MERKIIEQVLMVVFLLLGGIGTKVFTTDSLPWEISQCVLVLSFIGAALLQARYIKPNVDKWMDRRMDRCF